MQVDGYEIDILIQGYPGRSLFHGGLGWCTVVLIRGQGRVVLIDTGSFNFRRPLIERLAKRGVKPAAVTDLLLTHADYDHMVNWTLFGHARIVIGAYELECALKAPWGETAVPELYVRELHGWPNLHTVGDGDDVLALLAFRPEHPPSADSVVDLVFVHTGAPLLTDAQDDGWTVGQVGHGCLHWSRRMI